MDVLVKAQPGQADLERRAGARNDHQQLGGDRASAGQSQEIKDWPDLAKPGVGVLYPDPKTSGGARWNINAIYGAAFLASRDSNQGKPDLQAVRGFPGESAGQRRQHGRLGPAEHGQFRRARHTGDAVVTYEDEILLHNKGKGKEPIPYVIPPATLLIEGPGGGGRDLGGIARQPGGRRGFPRIPGLRSRAADLRGLWVPAGESRCAPAGRAGCLPPKLFTMADLGGWAKLERELYGSKGLWTSIFTAEASARALGK